MMILMLMSSPGDDSNRADIDGDDGDVSGGVIEACWSIGGNWGVMSHTGDSCIDEHNTWKKKSIVYQLYDQSTHPNLTYPRCNKHYALCMYVSDRTLLA